MKISKSNIKRIISEEISVYKRGLSDAQFGYIIHALMSNPSETVSNDLYEPITGTIILRKGESISDISDTGAGYLYKHHNIDIDPPETMRRRRRRPDKPTRPSDAPVTGPARSGPTEVQAVASSLSGYVSSGSRPLRNDIERVVADPKRDEIAVYLRAPRDRIATDQEIACALRYLLDQKVQASGKFVINPCGFGQRANESLIVIVKI
jgi:hypothetical protein